MAHSAQLASICLGEALSGGDFRAVRPVDSVRKMPATPIMVIHGERDEFVSGDQIEELIQATAGPKELWILDCGHAMARLEHADQYKDRVLRFFDSHLRPNRESGDELGRLGDDN